MSLLWDVYTDETPASSDMNVWVPAVFGEYAGESGRWSWIHGLRIERPSDQGTVVAPRVAVEGRIKPAGIGDTVTLQHQPRDDVRRRAQRPGDREVVLHGGWYDGGRVAVADGLYWVHLAESFQAEH